MSMRCERCGAVTELGLQAMLDHVCPLLKPQSNIRRNFVHNCITHPFCGVIWLIADISGYLRIGAVKDILVTYGERLHSGKR